MSDQKPTPPPWKVEALRGCKVVIKTEQDLMIAVMCDEPNRSRNQAIANASMIVTLANKWRRERDALWHFATCPYDHCERCIEDEQLIKEMRDEMHARELGDTTN